MRDLYTSINYRQFLELLLRSKSSQNLFCNRSDESEFEENLLAFCNTSHDYSFSDDDFATICSFLFSSIRKILQSVVSSSEVSDYYYRITGSICTLSRYIALYWKNRFSRSYFDSALTYLILFPSENNMSSDTGLKLLNFYYKSSLLESIALSTDMVMNYSLSESLLSPFMRIVRKSDYCNIFPFYLHRFNSQFFRHSYKIFPDDCSVTELYHGLSSGYFASFGFEDEAVRLLSSSCDNLSLEDLSVKSLSNPLYAIWNLYSDSVIPSLKVYSAFFELLFCN